METEDFIKVNNYDYDKFFPYNKDGIHVQLLTVSWYLFKLVFSQNYVLNEYINKTKTSLFIITYIKIKCI